MQLVRDWVEQLGLVAGSLQVLQSWEDPWSLDACLCATLSESGRLGKDKPTDGITRLYTRYRDL